MPSERSNTRLDLLYEEWLRFSADGSLIECSGRLKRTLHLGGPGAASVKARELFALNAESSEQFFNAWITAVKGEAGSMPLTLNGSEETKSYLFAPVFDEADEVSEVVLGAIRSAPSVGAHDYGDSVRNTLGKLSEMKELFRDIAKANKHLETALKSAKAQVDLATSESEAKTAFLANMSHEIRTPMNAVIGFCDLLSNTDLSQEQSEYVDAINQSGQLLIKLIGQVLDYSKIESGHLDLEHEALSLQQIILEIRAIMSSRLGDKDIDFAVDLEALDEPSLFGDETRVKQILLNLLSNALKFTRKGKVTLHAASARSNRPGHQRLICRIEDTGIGIASDRIDSLFDPFAQANQKVSKEFGGSGLGLAICKRLCAAMHGDVWIERTELGKGSVFAFEIHLPTAKPEEDIARIDHSRDQVEFVSDRMRAGDDANGSRSRFRLLVVDDNPNNLLITSKLSQYLGYEAESVRNGIEAIEKLKETPFDIVLMDVRMSPLSGIETTRRIRGGEAGDRCSSAYIIAVTAHALQGDRERCLDSGMNDYLSKPLTLERLEESLNKARSELSLD